MKLMMKTLILVIGLSLLSSCQTTQLVNQKYPIIPKPDRPTLSQDLDEEDIKKLIRHIKKLEIGIDEYNKYAEEENLKIEQHFENRD